MTKRIKRKLTIIKQNETMKANTIERILADQIFKIDCENDKKIEL